MQPKRVLRERKCNIRERAIGAGRARRGAAPFQVLSPFGTAQNGKFGIVLFLARFDFDRGERFPRTHIFVRMNLPKTRKCRPPHLKWRLLHLYPANARYMYTSLAASNTPREATSRRCTCAAPSPPFPQASSGGHSSRSAHLRHRVERSTLRKKYTCTRSS